MKKFLTHVFRPGKGRTVPSATVRVKLHPSTSGSANAIIYSDSGGNSTIVQPFLANANGMVEFYAPDGRYDLYFTIPDPTFGTIEDVWTDVTIDSSDSTNALIAPVLNGHFIVHERDLTLPNSVVIPTFKGHPDIPPASPGSIDNEFDAVGPNFSNFGADVNTVITAVDGRLRLRQSVTERTAPAVGLERVFTPSGNFTISSMLRLGYHAGMVGGEISGARPMWGIGLRSNLGEIITISVRAGAQGVSVYRADYSAAALVSSNPGQQIGSNACYVRIRKVGSTLFFEWSVDGFTYVTIDEVAQSSVMSGAIAYVGLYAYATFDTGGFIDCYADFIRQT